MFKNKILLITGGTGSFGNAVLDKFLDSDLKEIRIFSRDEKKQDDMRHIYQAKFPELSEKIKFYIGDVRDRETIISAMNGVDYVFHAAALKQVPSCEFFPLEAVKTNVIGTDNVLSVAINAAPVMANSLLDDHLKADPEGCQGHDHFHNLTPESEWKTCLAHAEKLGMGTRAYELVTVK